MTGDGYLHFLQHELPEQLKDVPLDTRRHMYLQHDGSPIHYIRKVTQHLNNTYPNQWIGRGSLIHWPARSPDLTLLDFCLWGWLKGEVYHTKVDTLNVSCIMLVYYFLPFIVNNRYLLFEVSSGHNSVTVQNRTHVCMNFFA